MAKRTSTVTRIPVPNMLGGVSRLPPALRAPNALEDALNVTSHFARGLEKRPGTEKGWFTWVRREPATMGIMPSKTMRPCSSMLKSW